MAALKNNRVQTHTIVFQNVDFCTSILGDETFDTGTIEQEETVMVSVVLAATGFPASTPCYRVVLLAGKTAVIVCSRIDRGTDRRM